MSASWKRAVPTLAAIEAELGKRRLQGDPDVLVWVTAGGRTLVIQFVEGRPLR